MGRKNKKYELKHKPRKSRGGIWVTNKFGKYKSKKKHPPKPIVKRCIKCGTRVLYHHFYCDNCWREAQEYGKSREEMRMEGAKLLRSKKVQQLPGIQRELSGIHTDVVRDRKSSGNNSGHLSVNGIKGPSLNEIVK